MHLCSEVRQALVLHTGNMVSYRWRKTAPGTKSAQAASEAIGAGAGAVGCAGDGADEFDCTDVFDCTPDAGPGAEAGEGCRPGGVPWAFIQGAGVEARSDQ